jgi:hypothetical protein
MTPQPVFVYISARMRLGGARVKAVERALRAEMRAMPGLVVASSSLAVAAVGLARRLDAGPGDDAATRLTRELRLLMAELHRQSGGDTTGDVEAFLARIAAPDGGHAAD